MDRKALEKQLIAEEGCTLKVYHGKTDRPGVWTVGCGHRVLPQDHLTTFLRTRWAGRHDPSDGTRAEPNTYANMQCMPRNTVIAERDL